MRAAPLLHYINLPDIAVLRRQVALENPYIRINPPCTYG